MTEKFKQSILTFKKVKANEHSIFYEFNIDGVIHKSKITYHSINLKELEQKFSIEFITKVYLFMGLILVSKLAGSPVREIRLGEYSKYFHENINNEFQNSSYGCLQEYRYKNDMPNQPFPKIVKEGNETLKIKRVEIETNKDNSNSDLDYENKGICLVGGGKDSYGMVQILKKAKIDFDILSINYDEYGDLKKQEQIISKMVNAVKNETTIIHHIDIQDKDLIDYMIKAPTVEVMGMFEIRLSIILCFLIQLKYGIKHVFIGNEKTADYPNLYWEKEGDINHQWEKTLTSEKLYNSVIWNNLSTNSRFMSILKPLRDPVIFNCGRTDETHFHLCHSCNVSKPWCHKCPKCFYVLISSLGFMTKETGEKMQKSTGVDLNFLSYPENELYWKQFLGIEPNIPFECVGQVPDSTISFMLAYLKGYKGKAIDEFINLKVKKSTIRRYIEKCFHIDEDYQFFPDSIKKKLLDVIVSVAEKGKEDALKTLEDYKINEN